MKIAYLGIKGLPAKGGSERVVEAIVQRLSPKHKLTVYCSRHYTSADSEVAGVNLIRLPCLSGKYSHMVSFDLMAACHALLCGDYDLIHLHNIEASFVLPILRLKFKVVSTAHGRHALLLRHSSDPLGSKWGPVAIKIMSLAEIPYARLSNALTSVSQGNALALSHRFHKNVRYLPNGVDLEPLVDLDSARSILSKHSQKEGEYLVFATGRMIPSKGVHLILEAFEGVGGQTRLLVIGAQAGPGVYAEQLKQYSTERVIFLPFLENRAALLGLLQLSRLFIFPSIQEAMSMMLLEAASVGVPILCSDIPGNMAVLPEQALYFSSQDATSLREKLAWALEHPEEMKSLGMEAREHVRQNYAWDQIVQKYEQLYQEVVANG